MKDKELSDPVSLIIKECHQSEDEANRIYHLLAEERQHRITLAKKTVICLSDDQLGEFAERFSSEVKPKYWRSKRLKH